jgi:hypothetical protein
MARRKTRTRGRSNRINAGRGRKASREFLAIGDTASSVVRITRDTLLSAASGATALGAGALTVVVDGAWIVLTFVSRTAGRVAGAAQGALAQALTPARSSRSSRRVRHSRSGVRHARSAAAA